MKEKQSRDEVRASIRTSTERIEVSYVDAVRVGHERPVVLVCDLGDRRGRAVIRRARLWPDEDVKTMRAEAARCRNTVFISFAADAESIARIAHGAIAPRLAERLLSPPPAGRYWILAFLGRRAAVLSKAAPDVE